MSENRILTNLPFGFDNRSNFLVSKEDVEDLIWEVPYFPVQNMVMKPEFDIYSKIGSIFFPDGVNDRLIGILNTTIQTRRIIFVIYDDNKRHIEYRFAGNSYPSGRSDFSWTYDGTRYFYLFGGIARGRCLRDLWRYDIVTNSWELLFGLKDTPVNFSVGRRKDASIIVTPIAIHIAGGIVDSDIGNVDIILNDVWEYKFQTDEWIKYDRRAILPRTKLRIVYADNNEIYLLANDRDIWKIVKSTDNVTKVATISPLNIEASFYLGDKYIVKSGNTWYEFNRQTLSFSIVRNNAIALDNNLNYWIDVNRNTKYGEVPELPNITVYEPELRHRSTNAIIKKCNIKPIPNMHIFNYLPLPENKHFYFSGYIYGTLLEYTWIFNGNTNNIEWYTTPDIANTMTKPNERYACGLCYDDWNNRIWLFGGFDGSVYYNDLWYFDLNTKTWHKVMDNISSDNRTFPAPRANVAIEFVQGYIYIIGGYNDQESFNDFWRYHIPTNTWEKIQLVDHIPFGTGYVLFRYRDRLWLFNGSLRGIYRYFPEQKQFVIQPLYMELSDELIKAQQQNRFLEFPITLRCIEEVDRVYIHSPSGYLLVDMRDRKVLSSHWNNDIVPRSRVIWLTPSMFMTNSIENSGKIGIYNYSQFYSQTYNELPSPFYMSTTLDEFAGGNDGNGYFFRDVITNQTYWVDQSGMFYIYEDWNDIKPFYQPDQVTGVYYNAYVNTSSRNPDFNYYDAITQILYFTLKELIEGYRNIMPVFRYTYLKPPFNKNIRSIFISKDNRIYLVESGANANIYRYSPSSYSWFKYYTNIWSGATIAYDPDQNKFYVFGGTPEGKQAFDQNGIGFLKAPIDGGLMFGSSPNLNEYNNYSSEIQTPIGISFYVDGTNPATDKRAHYCHNGFMIYDLNYGTMQINYLTTLPENIVRFDYEYIKDFLIEWIQNNPTDNLSQIDIESVKNKFYDATQKIIDDLSTRDIYRENGVRPTPRAFSLSYFDNITKNWYIFGGVHIDIVEAQEDGVPVIKSVHVHTYRDLWVFNTSTRTWTRLTSAPIGVHSGSITMTPDRKYLVVIGGLNDKTNHVNRIMLYDIAQNRWEILHGLPTGMIIGTTPALYWTQDHKLIIMPSPIIGLQKEMDSELSKVHKLTSSIYIYDYYQNVIYKAHESEIPEQLVVVDDPNNFYPTHCFCLSKKINEIQFQNNLKIPYTNIYTYNLSKKKDNKKVQKFYYIDINNRILSISDIAMSREIKEIKIDYAFLYKDNTIVSVTTDIETFRLFKIVIDRTPLTATLLQVPYPIPARPICFAFDGTKYLYVIYNGYNIWRLDLSKVMTTGIAEETDWLLLPPVPDLNEYVPTFGFKEDNGYMVFINNSGLIIRFKPETYAWFLDSKYFVDSNAEKLTYTNFAVDYNDNYIYYINRDKNGGILYEYEYKQMDEFYFITTRLNEIKQQLPIGGKNSQLLTTNDNTLPQEYRQKLATMFSSLFTFEVQEHTDPQTGLIVNVEVKPIEIKYPTFIKNSKLFTWNSLGHMVYAYVRKYGIFKAYWNLNELVDATKLRIYADVRVLQQFNTNIELFEVGIVDQDNTYINITSTGSVYINEIDWFYDERRESYRRDFPNGSYTLSKCPPNYIEFSIPQNKFVKRVYVKYIPKPTDYNYIAYLNKVELISFTDKIQLFDIAPVDLVIIEPFDTSYSPIYMYQVKNSHNKTVYKPTIYIKDNEHVQFSIDGSNWKIATQNDPLVITELLQPNESINIYMRCKKYFYPFTRDIVLTGYYEL